MVACGNMEDSNNKLVVRTTKHMQKVLRKVATSNVQDRQSFAEEAVSKNIGYIVSCVEGQNALRDFIEGINSTVSWIHIEPPNQDIQDRLNQSDSLKVQQGISLNNDVKDMVDAASKYSGQNRSCIIRICMIKHLYDNKDKLMQTNSVIVNDLWLDIERKLKLADKMLIDKIYYGLERDFILSRKDVVQNYPGLISIRDHYKELKGTKGHDTMLNYERGEEVDQVLQEVESIVENHIN